MVGLANLRAVCLPLVMPSPLLVSHLQLGILLLAMEGILTYSSEVSRLGNAWTLDLFLLIIYSMCSEL